MPKPSDFLIGVLDFFAVLLPGCMAVAMLRGFAGDAPLSAVGATFDVPHGGLDQWAIFLTLGYLVGHLIFLAGSLLDGIYGPLYKRLVRKPEDEALYSAERLRAQYLGDISIKAINTFQWARSVLVTTSPDAAADVHRLEADSKFFRSIVMLSLISAAAWAYHGNGRAALTAAGVGVVCFWRYFERRRKSTRSAYIHLMTLSRTGRLPREGEAGSPGDVVPPRATG